MVGEWRVQTFAELVGGRGNIIGGPFGSNLTQADYTQYGMPIIRGSNMQQAGRFIGGEFAYVSEEKASRLSSNQISPGDVVVTQRGTLGQVSLVPSNGPSRYIVSQSQMGVRALNAEPMFVYYLLRSPAFASLLEGATIQTGVPHINMGILRSWEVGAPGRREQVRIADLLGSLDDAIDLNRGMAETLEEMARALFQSWFIDFDPVRAKAENLPTGLSDDLAALFPNSFGEDGLPEGWELDSVGSLVDVNPRISVPVGARVPYVDMAALPTRSARVRCFIERPAGSGSRFQNDDTLVARITPCLENGKTAIVDFLNPGEAAWGSTEFIVMRPRAGIPSSWPYLLARHEPFRAHLIASMSGTSGRQRVPPSSVERWEIAQPSEQVLKAFGELTSPMFRRIQTLDAGGDRLAALRDVLLPRLISGELRITDAEREVAAA